MPTVKKYIEELQGLYKPDDVIAVHLWQVEDVLMKAEEMKIRVSKKKAKEIIEDIHQSIDSELGVSWTTIECALEDVK